MKGNRRHKSAKNEEFLSFLKNFLDLFGHIFDIISSMPAKPLPQGTLNSGGFSFFRGMGRR